MERSENDFNESYDDSLERLRSVNPVMPSNSAEITPGELAQRDQLLEALVNRGNPILSRLKKIGHWYIEAFSRPYRHLL